ncbi:MAG TPA: translocation/assembly module TamB domain-containing protein [Chthoniobacterales bacterium]|nr:translocation/assembly module TamB domain-containing protein [Chthoniobacterales bacterium]
MGEYGQGSIHAGDWRRRALIALGIFCALLLIFHRPLLLYIGRKVALHYAAKENLKVEFRLEGSVFTNLTVRNLHAVPTGPSDVESIDIDLARVDYGLFTLMRHGISNALHNVDVRSARIVMNPARAPLRPRPPNPKKKIELPDIFPERIHIADATVIVRNRPHDFIAEHANVDLDPRRSGEVRVDKLQLVGGQVWLKLAAQATYSNRNLTLRDIVLGDDERFRSINFDASQIAARKLGINFDYVVADGKVNGAIALRESHDSLDTNVRIRSEKVPLSAINKFAALPQDWLRGSLEKFDVDLSGLLSSPASWHGNLTAIVTDFRQEQTAFDRGEFQIVADNGVATLQSAEIKQQQNEFHVKGSTELPRDIRDLGRAPATLELASKIPDLQQLTATMPEKLSGSAQVNGKVNVSNANLDGDFTVSAPSTQFKDGHFENLNATIKVSKKIPPADSNKPWFDDLVSDATVSVSDIRFRDYVADSVTGSLHSKNDLVTFDRFLVRRKQNEFAVSGNYRLPNDVAKAAEQSSTFDLSSNVPELADFWVANSADKISGPLKAAGRIEWKNGMASGRLSIFGANLRMRDLVFTQINTDCEIWNNVVYLNYVSAKMNDQDFVRGNGIIDLGPRHHYIGKWEANISDLSKLRPLLRTFGNQNELSGSLVMEWEGRGETVGFKRSGAFRFALDNARYGNARSLQAHADATYSPDGVDIPTIFVRSDKTYFQAIAQANGDELEIDKIELDQAQAKYAGGYMSVPFIWKNLGTGKPLFSPNGKVTAAFQSENLDIKKLFQDVGLKPAASGSLNVKFDASGTLADLNARLDVQMRDLRSLNFEKFEPASVDLTAQTKAKQLTISGKLQQAKIQPLELIANLPFDTPKIANAGKLPDNTPVNAKLRLSRTSVNFMRQFIPGVEELDGDAALDVDVRGTIAQPVLTGNGDMTINVARMTDPTLPAVQNFKGRVNFANNALKIEQCRGDLSGGHFAVSGGATFPTLRNADLNFQLKADSALIARNDALTVRADADIKLIGPFTGANVTGTIALTNSQLLKNLDLMPIGLPGRPAPQPPSSRPTFSIPQLPVRNWKFDVTIKTKDPFLIRGNLANGGAISNLHLTGTGLHPGLEGYVRLDNVDATLPFSRLEISSGFLYFDPSDPFNPKIDMHGKSVIRDYTINVYLYGTSLAPEAIFTSEPPLAQEEIISLLATGTTREELTGNNNVLAGRAATLLVQQLYRKAFKKGQGTQSSSVFDRLDLDVGTVDPRTGQQQAIARFKVNDQFVVLGDVGVGGDYRGMVKYLIRFR